MTKVKKIETKIPEIRFRNEILRLQLKTGEFVKLEDALGMSIWAMIQKFQNTKSGLGFRELTNIIYCASRKNHPDITMQNIYEIIEDSELPEVVEACINIFLQGLRTMKIIPAEAKK
ncbi:MAG: hypothetical protein IID17_10380 [Nitrospinae bacterium]|nr:hypothetical protein [Nitrospinota bacterium]